MSEASTYDPFALDKPVLRLGEHGDWKLGDLTDVRVKRIQGCLKAVEELQANESPAITDVAAVIGRLAEAACEDAEGLALRISELSDPEKYGDQALGVKALTGLAAFINEWYLEEAAAGEG